MKREVVESIGNYDIVAIKDDKGNVLYYIVDGFDDQFDSLDKAISFINRILLPPARPIEEVFAEIEKMDEEAAKSKASAGASLKL
ncbi:MAG: hypothetical protein WC279_02650 [Sulfurimonas sp.]|jgi:hypothetical protein|uniref:hypothetical protein n=1 Tax=Sulfurimonas sp. TaxID=2022749 RepID=UPI003566D6BC